MNKLIRCKPKCRPTQVLCAWCFETAASRSKQEQRCDVDTASLLTIEGSRRTHTKIPTLIAKRSRTKTAAIRKTNYGTVVVLPTSEDVGGFLGA